MSKSNRRGFFGALGAATAAPLVAQSTPRTDPKRILVLYDLCQIETSDLRDAMESLAGDSFDAVMLGVMELNGDPIRILSLDGLTAETVESISVKILAATATQRLTPLSAEYRYVQVEGKATIDSVTAAGDSAFWKHSDLEIKGDVEIE
jgi:hypothetical protein